MVAPVVVGNGRRLFPDGGAPAGLRLLGTETTPGGLAIQNLEWVGPPSYATYSGASALT